MRFAYAGIDFLGDVFDTLVEAGWQPVKLFTRRCDGIFDTNDVVIARAHALGLPIQLSRIQPADFATLHAMNCDALIVAGYPWLMKGWRSAVPYGLNVHPSPLPIGRGPYPLFRALLEDVENWGVTAHVLDDSFDTGAIIAQELFPVSAIETHDTLLLRCQVACKRLARRLARDLPRLWSEAQPQSGGVYWSRTTPRERTIDWSRNVADVMRVVRSFGSLEVIAQLGNQQVFIYGANGWTEPHRHQPGVVVHSYRRHRVVAVRDGYILVSGWSPISLPAARSSGR